MIVKTSIDADVALRAYTGCFVLTIESLLRFSSVYTYRSNRGMRERSEREREREGGGSLGGETERRGGG
jgi:hypothetical protein